MTKLKHRTSGTVHVSRRSGIDAIPWCMNSFRANPSRYEITEDAVTCPRCPIVVEASQ